MWIFDLSYSIIDSFSMTMTLVSRLNVNFPVKVSFFKISIGHAATSTEIELTSFAFSPLLFALYRAMDLWKFRISTVTNQKLEIWWYLQLIWIRLMIFRFLSARLISIRISTTRCNWKRSNSCPNKSIKKTFRNGNLSICCFSIF